MKESGIVRRVDELGRIVIPKEIRNKLRINSGQNLEIYINNDNIVLSKHSIINNIKDISKEIVDSINSIIHQNVLITDLEKIVSISGTLKKQLENKYIDDNVVNIMLNRTQKLNSEITNFKLVNNINVSYIISTIIVNGEVIGSIICLSENNELTNKEYDIIKIFNMFLTKYLEY